MKKLTEEQLAAVKVALQGQVRHLAPKVAPVYKLLNWTWADDKNTPTEDEVSNTLNGLIDHLEITETGKHDCSAGGLHAKYEIEADGRVDLEIGMYIWEWASVSFDAGEVG